MPGVKNALSRTKNRGITIEYGLSIIVIQDSKIGTLLWKQTIQDLNDKYIQCRIILNKRFNNAVYWKIIKNVQLINKMIMSVGLSARNE